MSLAIRIHFLATTKVKVQDSLAGKLLKEKNQLGTNLFLATATIPKELGGTLKRACVPWDEGVESNSITMCKQIGSR